MPVELNTNINATCTVNEIRPEPSEFYWMLGDTRVQGLGNSSVVNINNTYDVRSVYGIVSHTAVVDEYDTNLTCVLVIQNGEELRSLHIDIIGVGKGMCIMIFNSVNHSCVMRIMHHFLLWIFVIFFIIAESPYEWLKNRYSR